MAYLYEMYLHRVIFINSNVFIQLAEFIMKYTRSLRLETIFNRVIQI